MLPGDSKEMNERIRQLAGQALDRVVPYTWTRLDYDEIQRLQEYFAQLIVRECGKVIVNGGYRNPALGEKLPLTPPEIATMIKEHFGVEE